MQMKTRWILSAGSVLLLVVALLIWGRFAPTAVAMSVERTIIAKLNEPVPLGSGRGVGRWHWEGYELISGGVKLMSLELRSESGGEKLFRAEEVTVTQQSRRVNVLAKNNKTGQLVAVTQQSKGVVVALARWDGVGRGVTRGQWAYAETLVPLVEMISLVANAAPDPISFIEIMVADIHGVSDVEGQGKAAAELRAEIMNGGGLILHMSAHRASSGLRAHFEITFMGRRIRSFADLATEIRELQLAPMITLAEIELYDAGAQMRSNPDWQEPKEAIRVSLLKAGMLDRSSAPRVYNWLYTRPDDVHSSQSLRLSGEMQGDKLRLRVTNECMSCTRFGDVGGPP